MVKDDAVSPVIGVILMVAITVILAAVIAAFVFGMAGSVSATKNVAFIAELGQDSIVTITNHGGNDLAQLVSLAVSDGSTTLTEEGGGTFDEDAYLTVGSSVAVDLATTGATGDRLILTGTFADGTTAVLLDRTW